MGCVASSTLCASDGVNRVHRVEPPPCGLCPQELLGDTQGTRNLCALRTAAFGASQWGRGVLRPTIDQACQPRNAHATSAQATEMAATTNQMSVVRATRLRVGLNPMRSSMTEPATDETHHL